MATYAIGDIQGCFLELETLLSKISFSAKRDRLWFVGDLVNRGPQSLETLEFVISLGKCATTVLGNHDIHLIACYTGHKSCKKESSLTPILQSPDVETLINWLRFQPLMHTDTEIGHSMIHAGLLPQWDLNTARLCAAEVELELRSNQFDQFIGRVYGDDPPQWNDKLTGIERLRVITNAFTRLRFCDQDGAMNFEYKGPPGTQPVELRPWFQWPHRKSKDDSLIFGHWSALGLYQGNNILAIDSGCLWGGSLTAARIDVSPIQIYTVACSESPKNIP